MQLPPIAPELVSAPGERTDPAEELEAFARQPLQSCVALHYDSCVWEIARGWGVFLRYATMLARADRKAERAGARPVPSRRTGAGAPDAELTAALRRYLAALGLGTLGVAAFDPNYMTEQGMEAQAGESRRRRARAAVRTHSAAVRESKLGRTYDSEAESLELTVKVARFLWACGFRVHAHDKGDGMTIPFAGAAGMGQLGLNG